MGVNVQFKTMVPCRIYHKRPTPKATPFVTVNCIHSFICVTAFPLIGSQGSSPERTRSTSCSTAISDSSAGYKPRRDQATSEMWSCHLVSDNLWAAFPCICGQQDLFANFSCDILDIGRTNAVEISRFVGRFVRHSGFYEFHSCATLSRSVTPWTQGYLELLW